MQMGQNFAKQSYQTLVAGKQNGFAIYSKREGYLQHTFHFHIALES